jgi:hypothetical protein
MYNVTFGDEATVLAVDDFESIEEVCEFINESLVEHGEGEWQIAVAAFDADDEGIEDEP